jgi:KDO2-lipid IV(A) lauroyltransferase
VSKRSQSRDMLEYLAARVAYAFLAPCPPKTAVRLSGALAGPLLYALLPRARRRGRANLDVVFGASLSDAEKERILRGMFGHLAQMALEFALYRQAPCSLPFSMDTESRDSLESALRRGPVVFVTAHLGNWEVFGVSGGGMSLPLNTVARPMDNPRLDRWIRSRREAGPQKTYPTHGAPIILSKALGRGEPVVVVGDHNQRKHGVFVSFFGVPAATTRTPALLALRARAPVVAGCLVREGGPFRFRAYFAPPVYPEPDQPLEAEVARITQTFTATFESWIRRFPEQWLWSHRRWRTRPD